DDLVLRAALVGRERPAEELAVEGRGRRRVGGGDLEPGDGGGGVGHGSSMDAPGDSPLSGFHSRSAGPGTMSGTSRKRGSMSLSGATSPVRRAPWIRSRRKLRTAWRSRHHAARYQFGSRPRTTSGST